ncbi:MAG: NAD(P)-dependent oxidoreductase [Rhodobacteraceae bacterium]|nr:NAD(P)-dependent oxidoreductase [Paracoccaceae bacterium]
MDAVGIAGSHRVGPAMLARLHACGLTADGYGLAGGQAPGLSDDPSAFLLGLRILVLVPRDIAEAEALLFETGALARNGRSLHTIVIASTLSPRYVRALRGRIQPSVSLVDAPFAGTQQAAEMGALSFLLGGRSEDVERLQPVFEALGNGAIHMGSFGAAMAAKVLNDFLAASSAAMTRIALDWAEAQGIDDARLLEMTRATLGSRSLLQGHEAMRIATLCATSDPSLSALMKEVEHALDTALAGAHLTPPRAVETLMRNMKTRALH